MKAIVCGPQISLESLAQREVEKPVPVDGQVLIKVIATSVNAYDYRCIQIRNLPKSRVLGTDVAGIVEAVGGGVTKFKVGDAVFGDLSSSGCGGYAEYVAAPEKLLALKPDNVTFEQAAALPMASLTALQGLREVGGIQPGHKVLICGAGGGVGTFAVQLAALLGADVTAVCGPHNVDLVRSLGARRVIDYTLEDFAKQDQRYDLVFVVNGSRPLSAYKRVLVNGGRCVVAGGSYKQVFSALLFGKLLSSRKKKLSILMARMDVQALAWMINLVGEGKITPVIDKRYPLAGVPEALKYLAAGHARGKVIINSGND